MAAAKETPNRVGSKARMERLLGMPERNDSAFLSMRQQRGTISGGSAETSHNSGRRDYAAYS